MGGVMKIIINTEVTFCGVIRRYDTISYHTSFQAVREDNKIHGQNNNVQVQSLPGKFPNDEWKKTLQGWRKEKEKKIHFRLHHLSQRAGI